MNTTSTNATQHPHPHLLVPIGRDTPSIELTVMGWFAAGHELLWVPIFEVDGGPGALAEAQADADKITRRGPYIVRQLTDLYWLPMGIRGWLIPAHQARGYGCMKTLMEWSLISCGSWLALSFWGP